MRLGSMRFGLAAAISTPATAADHTPPKPGPSNVGTPLAVGGLAATVLATGARA